MWLWTLKVQVVCTHEGTSNPTKMDRVCTSVYPEPCERCCTFVINHNLFDRQVSHINCLQVVTYVTHWVTFPLLKYRCEHLETSVIHTLSKVAIPSSHLWSFTVSHFNFHAHILQTQILSTQLPPYHTKVYTSIFI